MIRTQGENRYKCGFIALKIYKKIFVTSSHKSLPSEANGTISCPCVYACALVWRHVNVDQYFHNLRISRVLVRYHLGAPGPPRLAPTSFTLQTSVVYVLYCKRCLPSHRSVCFFNSAAATGLVYLCCVPLDGNEARYRPPISTLHHWQTDGIHSQLSICYRVSNAH